VFPVCFNFRKFILPFQKFKPKNNNKAIQFVVNSHKTKHNVSGTGTCVFHVDCLPTQRFGILSNHFRKQLIIIKFIS